MFKFDLSGGNNVVLGGAVALGEPVIIINGSPFYAEDAVNLFVEVQSLKEKNKYLQAKNKSLDESVNHYQEVIEKNLAGTRCKELEGDNKRLESYIGVLKIINQEKENVIDGLKSEIDCQKQDIERLVKLNSKLISELEGLKYSLDVHKKVLYTTLCR